ncbi:hypothetical protein [Clostridium thailandense]|uniref:Lipoprotein n=1 Tax=Clostridium thailandense TaxID=2794346 RepID=A0A949X3M8_9CLOT|nr:hypothetical protein [Clostridium thailandense]MBV7272643.1 hypothetical protein [Clostridium thailandense]
MKKTLRNFTIFLLILAAFMSFTGCSLTQKNNNSSKTEVKTNEAPKIVEDKKNTDQLKTHKELLDGKVYTQGDYAVATMIIKDNVSEADAKTLAESYAKQLKQQYSNKKINVQAVKGGKNIANVTLN